MLSSTARQVTELPPDLAAANEQIRATAKSYGLDFFETIFEMLDYDQINQIASFGGFPVRYPHWRFGMEYERMSKQHNYGLGRIYEMVINNDPCYAYLQRSNSITDQKLVMAHVYAHCDFFKNNLWFSKTDRKMMDNMANHATRVRKHIERIGIDRVEKFLDVCLSIEHLIDPHSAFLKRAGPDEPLSDSDVNGSEEPVTRFQSKGYMERFINPRKLMEEERARMKAEVDRKRKIVPAEPVRDVLLFLLQHAPLQPWQADILTIIRDEAYYFSPQGMTKVMNEGWATYWHSTMMTKHYLASSEIIDYADHHSGTVHMPPGNFNPYKIGVELFRDIEDRWDHGRHGKEFEELDTLGGPGRWNKESPGEGRKKIFEVRRIYNDVNFIDEFLTEEMVDRLKLYQYRRDPHTGQLRIVSRDYKRIKESLLYRLTNMGQPYIYVVDANYKNAGELYLAHKHNGLDIEIKYAIETLKGVQHIWTRPVHLQARIDDDMMLFSYDGKQSHQQKIHDDLPKPAHQL